MSAAGAATSAISASQAASAEKDAADFNAKVAENDATVARQKSKYEADRLRERNRRVIAEQRGEYLASGLQLNGTVDDVIFDSSLQGELDALSTEYSGQAQANSSRSEAMLSRKRGAAAKSGVGLTVLGTALGAGGQMVNSYSIYNRGKAAPKSP
jgi:hypothetical protein